MATLGERAFQERTTAHAKALGWEHNRRGGEAARGPVCVQWGEAKGGKNEESQPGAIPGVLVDKVSLWSVLSDVQFPNWAPECPGHHEKLTGCLGIFS